MTDGTSSPQALPIADNPFALAILVLRERFSRLSKADQDDVVELLPALLTGDDEERASAIAAANEIMNSTTATVRPMEMQNDSTASLENWLSFFSQRLKAAREAAGLVQQELAEKTGIPQSQISRLENAQHSPSAKTIEKLALALSQPVSYFDPIAKE